MNEEHRVANLSQTAAPSSETLYTQRIGIP